jgi:hypothetical protein
VPLSFFGVAYVGAADIIDMRCIMDSVRHKVRAARCVANGVQLRLSIYFSCIPCWSVLCYGVIPSFLPSNSMFCFGCSFSEYIFLVYSLVVSGNFLAVLRCYS